MLVILKGFLQFLLLSSCANKSVEKPVPWHDFHATVLHLLGIDHEKLSYYHNGIQRRLTNVHGELLKDILV